MLMDAKERRKQIILSLCLTLFVSLIWYLTELWFVPVILLVIPFALYCILRVPFYIVLTFVIFSYFRIHEAFPILMPFRIPLLFSLCSFFVLAWHIYFSQQIKIYWTRELTALCIFFSWAAFGVLFANNKAAASGSFTGVLSKIWIMTIAICWLVRSLHHFRVASYLYIASGVLIAYKAISNKLLGIGLVEGTRVTISRDLGSLIGDPNDLSLVLLFPVSFAIATLLQPKLAWYYRLVLVLAIAVMFWAMMATQSRGGIVGIMALLGYFAFKYIKNKVWILVGAAVLIPVLLFLAGVSDRASGGAAEEGVDASAMGRIYAWIAAWRMALENPLTGVGLKNFYLNYYLYSPHWDGKNHAVHSTWFQVLAEMGFVGFILFMVLIVMIFKRLLATERACNLLPADLKSVFKTANDSIFAGFIGFCVAGTFLTQGFNWPLYILLAMTVALSKILSEHVNRLNVK